MRFIKRSLEVNLTELQDRMDKLLSEFMESSHPMMQLTGQCWHPAVDIYETETEVVVMVELPGVEAEKVEVVLHGDILHLSGERQLPTSGCARQHQLEISAGLFDRAVRLPFPVDPDRVKAKYKDGILTIACPRTKTSSVRVELLQDIPADLE